MSKKKPAQTPAAATPPIPQPPPPPAPTSPLGRQYAAKAAGILQELERAKQEVAAGQNHVREHTTRAIALTGQVQLLYDMAAEADREHAAAAASEPKNRAERRRLAAVH